MGKNVLVKLGGIGIAIIIAIVGSFVLNKGKEKVAEQDAPEVGTCLSVSGTVNAEHKEHDCSDPKATYKVVADDGSCDTNETSYKISIGSSDSGNVADLCLDLNAAKGDCFRLSSGEEKVDCAENKGDTSVFRIAAVGKPGDKCAKGTEPVPNVKRKSQLCLAPNA